MSSNKSNIEKLHEFPLRERKNAKTKIDLLFGMLRLTNDKRLDELSVRELCQFVDVSEGTFFNYFPKKEDMLFYFIKLWSLQTAYLADKEFGNTSGIKKIEHMLDVTTDFKTIGNVRIMGEIIAYFALNEIKDGILLDIPTAERYAAFPNYSGIEEVSYISMLDIYEKYLITAIQTGELPPTVDMQDAMVSIGVIFYGVPVILGPYLNPGVKVLYKKQLSALWERLRTSK